jgi:predicted ATPase
MLLVLDDVDGIQDMGVLLSEILRLAPGLHLLLTARERLHLRDAQTILVPPLAIPQTSDPEEVDTSSAVQLFIERARWEQPDFALAEEVAPHVVHICQLLDGLPLAIELAAAWVGALDCQTLAEELACDLDFLSSRAPDDVPARHQGLRAVFVTSWQRLTAEQQRVLAALSVFRSPVAREVARAVTDATSATLAALVDTSLLRRGADQRLVLPTSLRQYATEQLAESGAQLQVTQRYTQIMLQRVSDQTTALRGSQQQAVLHAVQRELPDIEVAWEFAVNERDVTLIQETAPALFHIYDIPSDFERGAWLFGLAHAALEPDMGTDMALAWGVVTSRYAWFRWHQGARDEALLLLEQARDVLAPLDTAAVVFAHNYLGAMAMHRHDHDQAVIHCETGQQIAQRVGDRYGEAIAGNIRAQVALEQGDLVEARQWARHSYLLEQQIGNRWSSAYSLTTLGREALARGDLDDARHYLSGALDIRQDMGDRRGQALCLGFLGDTLVAQQAFTQADNHYRAALVRYRDLGNDRGVADIITRMLRYRTSVGSDRAVLALIHDGLHAALRAGPPVGELASLLTAAVPILRAIDPVLADELIVGSITRSVAWNFYAAQAWRVLAQTTLGLPSTDQHALLDFNTVSRSSNDAGDQ